jgi:hypothetical protein
MKIILKPIEKGSLDDDGYKINRGGWRYDFFPMADRSKYSRVVERWEDVDIVRFKNLGFRLVRNK